MMSQRDNASCLESLECFLEHSVRPLVLEGLISIREQGKEFSQQNNSEMDEVEVTIQLLKEIKNWTQVLLDEEVRRILNKIPFLQKLLTALFVMKVKVLSVINMRKDTEEFPLTIPANTTFIHHVYIQCANILVDNSNVLADMSLVELTPLVQEAIRNACLACIAWSDLLSWGLDGVNVNEVINNIMKEDEQNNNTAHNEMSSADENNDEDFMNIANEEKMNQDEEEDRTQENDNADGDAYGGGDADADGDADGDADASSVNDNQNKNEDGEGSMFDLSNENDNVNNEQNDENEGSSIGDSASEIQQPEHPHHDGVPSGENTAAKVVTSSSPSFF